MTPHKESPAAISLRGFCCGAAGLFCKHGGGKIALAGVGEKGDDDLALVFGALGQLGRGKYGGAGGDADQKAFLSGQRAAGCKGVLVFDGDDLVVNGGVQGVRDETCANALDLVRAGRTLGQDGRACGLYGNDLHVGVLVLEVFTHAGDRTAGADACHEDVHLAIGIVPDLGAGGGAVCGGIGHVGELAGNEAARRCGGKLLSLGDGALHALRPIGQNQLSAVGLEQIAALDAHRFGHGEDDLVPSGGRDGSQADAGVAAGGLDDDRAGLQQALGLRIIDHGLGDSVLDASRRIEIFQLAVDRRAQLIFRDVVRQLQQRRSADQVGDSVVGFHGCIYSFVKDFCMDIA